jgi:hypothetical protein
VQRSAITLQPGRALQVAAPLGATWHRPEQQSVAALQVSLATRHPGKSTQPAALSSPPPHRPPQQSPSAAQPSPATRQPGPGVAHLPPVHSPEQQSLATAQATLAGAQSAPLHSPSLAQPSEQHAPARLQGWPVLAQPNGLPQASWPLPSSWQR